MAVAINQHHGFKPFSRSQRCKLQSFSHLDQTILELNRATLSHHSFKQKQKLQQQQQHTHLLESEEADIIHRSFSTPCLPLTTLSSGEDLPSSSHPRIEIVRGTGAPVHALVVEVAIAMASGLHPKPLPNGLGGAYLFCNPISGKNIAVAKPVDEEPLALNNPKDLGSQLPGQPGLKTSIRIGEAATRELAAYLLDHGSFAAVPPTALVKFSHASFFANDAPKLASLQRFIGHAFDAGELGPSLYSVSSVHQIGILDIRLLNLDRHAGNMLVMNHGFVPGVAAHLVPIDHGFCLPEWLDDPYFEWLHWPQASTPFSNSELDYISKLDPFKDAQILRSELPLLRESSIRVLVVCTIFLKHAAAAGLCLTDIGLLMTREFCGGKETPSELETICSQVKASVPLDVPNNNNEEEEGSSCEISGISFGDMRKGEWESFLEIFDKVLCGVFGNKQV
ncbi:phosphatidylinositol 4-kinase gamma 1-like [Arachis stenosperma]|uniref:phosphatidylinositol 4-kinase gamma 1-like n=1 Tax=Arachis stenosperma TaxID=217475 RepID=UPI0025AD66B4|nr:phosphatidylinositol 4-kinase gamma 1-like [Arachis stenosperma]